MLYAGCAPSGTTCKSKSNEIWGLGAIVKRFASALGEGAQIRPSKAFFKQAPKPRLYNVKTPVALLADFEDGESYLGYPAFSFSYGQWMYTKNRYIGLTFQINGETHYGWARVAVNVDRNVGMNATLTGYAYETIPNKPIIAGKTKGPDVITLQSGSLAGLAMGRK